MFKSKEKNTKNLLLKTISEKYGYSERYIRDSVKGILNGEMSLILKKDYENLEKELNEVLKKYKQKVSE